jgi:hypothetical protein
MHSTSRCAQLVIFALLFVISSALLQSQSLDSIASFRAPATPLIACDPYFSVWSFSDRLADNWTKHWTGANQALTSMIRIDGKTFRIAGMDPDDVPAFPQTNVRIYPTRTIYDFEGAGVHLTLTFLTPVLPYDLEVMSRPVNYLTWDVRAVDGARHKVSLYYDNSAELVVNTTDEKVEWSRVNFDSLVVLRMGSQTQPVLQRSGDNLRIDWGYMYLASRKSETGFSALTGSDNARGYFSHYGVLQESDDMRMPRAADDDWPVMSIVFNLGEVGAETVSRHIILAYDDQFSIEFLNRKLRPYWRRSGTEVDQLLRKAERDYAELNTKCTAFDEKLMSDLKSAGGADYCRLATLAYRQAFAAQKLCVDIDGTPLLFPKECFSNGCISTVDVLYPASPILLLLSPTLLKASITPVLEYAASDRWHFPFAPHDLGTYPLANGQVYGGGERTEDDQMPVEECGNMILMVGAVCHIDGNADYALKYWKQLSTWADYLAKKGLDPENQLCTDDFAGHLAHNSNLSIKAIVALGAYAQLCEAAGKSDEAARYRKMAEEFAAKWQTMAADGDHYRLAFDNPGTWSQKYNLVWDKIFGLKLFPAEVAKKEVAFYLGKLNPYGLPLDNRKDYTKIDWETWTATLAESPNDFASLIAPLVKFIKDTPDRVPLTDWYYTTTAKKTGSQARSVVGGIFIKMLADKNTWQKWSSMSLPH